MSGITSGLYVRVPPASSHGVRRRCLVRSGSRLFVDLDHRFRLRFARAGRQPPIGENRGTCLRVPRRTPRPVQRRGVPHEGGRAGCPQSALASHSTVTSRRASFSDVAEESVLAPFWATLRIAHAVVPTRYTDTCGEVDIGDRLSKQFGVGTVRDERRELRCGGAPSRISPRGF